MLTYDDLVNDMAKGVKPRDQWRIGIEHEQFLYDAKSGQPLPYDGDPGILQVLEEFIALDGWIGVREGDRLVALRKHNAHITLEPGGQFEFSGAPHEDLRGLRHEADGFYKALDRVARKLGVGVLRIGFHPEWRRDQIEMMPKERYAIMRPYMEKTGQYGVDMMLRSCGTQVNLDFSSEADMVKKYRVALGLQPVVIALMANSSRVEGADTGYCSYRSLLWTDTDPERCGVPEFVFGDDMGFARYVDYALDVKMYFIRRQGRYIDMTGQSFRDFMRGELSGYEGEYPLISDWHDHLSTLFPEVRLKSYLELRGPDSTEPDLVYAMAAFWTGIFYDADALDQAYGLIRDWPPEFHTRLRHDVTLHGLHSCLPEGQVFTDWALEAIRIADQGLARQTLEGQERQDLAALRNKITSS